MPITTHRTALAVVIALLPFAAPALAKSAKPIRLPARSLQDPAARLCMPKSVLAKPAADTPATICQTRDAWAAAGVTFEAR